MALTPTQIDLLQPGDRLYWIRSSQMGHTVMRRKDVESFLVESVGRDAAGVLEYVMVRTTRGSEKRSRGSLRRYSVYHPKPPRHPFERDEIYAGRLERALKRQAEEKAAWKQRIKDARTKRKTEVCEQLAALPESANSKLSRKRAGLKE